MKYLHDDRLAELTTLLTDCPLGGAVSQRFLHGRIEAYIMKRGSVDKKYAFKLGEKYVASLEHLAEDYSNSLQRVAAATRKRSQSAGAFEEAVVLDQAGAPPAKVQRNRASSFDDTRSELRNRTEQQPEMQPLVRFSAWSGKRVPSALGDFAEQGTRRLMTDLILTLNMSFPDFDFAAVRPTDFVRLSVENTVRRVNNLLSDVALRKESFLTDLWSSIDAVISLEECVVYSYQPTSADDQDDDPMAFLTETLTESFTTTGNDVSPTSMESSTASDSLGSQPTTMWTFNYFFVNKTIKRIILFTCVESMRNHEPDMREEDDGAFGAPSVGDSTELNFDLDPAAAPAGGIPISSL